MAIYNNPNEKPIICPILDRHCMGSDCALAVSELVNLSDNRSVNKTFKVIWFCGLVNKEYNNRKVVDVDWNI